MQCVCTEVKRFFFYKGIKLKLDEMCILDVSSLCVTKTLQIINKQKKRKTTITKAVAVIYLQGFNLILSVGGQLCSLYLYLYYYIF